MENHEGHDHSHDHAVVATGKATDRERVLGAISYIGPLFIVSYLMAENSKFVKFHASQGLAFFLSVILIRSVLALIMMTSYVPMVTTPRSAPAAMMYGFTGFFGVIMMIVSLGLLALAIAGIVKAAQGEQWEMPVIGKWAKRIQM